MVTQARGGPAALLATHMAIPSDIDDPSHLKSNCCMKRRLDQLLSSLGYCSRSEAKAFCRRHEVLAQGERILLPAHKVAPATVSIDGESLDHPRGLLILLHKPAGHVCSHDSAEGASVYDLLPARWLRRNPRIESIGRLDKDTTGVLLLTDNGQLNHRWTSPKHELDKLYLVTVDRPLEPALREHFARGDLVLEGEEKACRPAELQIIDPYRARLILTEGKYHQVKRMFAHFGYNVTRLHREQFGPWRADSLAPGEWQVLPPPADALTR